MEGTISRCTCAIVGFDRNAIRITTYVTDCNLTWFWRICTNLADGGNVCTGGDVLVKSDLVIPSGRGSGRDRAGAPAIKCAGRIDDRKVIGMQRTHRRLQRGYLPLQCHDLRLDFA